MANKKSSWLKKIANWVQGSLQRFADEGFAEGKQKRKRIKRALRVGASQNKPKKKPVKKGSSKAKTAKKIAVKKAKPVVKPKPVKASKAKAAAVKPISLKSKIKTVQTPVVKAKPLPGILVGEIAYYFAKANACAFKVQKVELKEGATILIQGPQTKLKMKLKSIQINRIPVPSGKPGEDIGIGVTKPVAAGDKVYLL